MLGPRAGDYYLVNEGLAEGELVVVKGNFKIDSALQIEAKPSMMSAADGQEQRHATIEVPGAFREQLWGIVEKYLSLHQALAGDDKYGDRDCNETLRGYGLNRMFLHAASVGVNRPGTREPLHVSAPLGADLHVVLESLLKAPGSRRGAARRRARSAAGR